MPHDTIYNHCGGGLTIGAVSLATPLFSAASKGSSLYSSMCGSTNSSDVGDDRCCSGAVLFRLGFEGTRSASSFPITLEIQ